MLKYYTRDRQGHPNGCIVAVKIGGYVGIGCSKCHKTDKFDKHVGTFIAKCRAMELINENKCFDIPDSMVGDFEKMVDRAKLFFKDCQVTELQDC